MCEFAYGGGKTSSSTPSFSEQQPTQPPTSTRPTRGGTRRRRLGPSMGVNAGAGADPAVDQDGKAKELDELMLLEGSAEMTDSDAMRSYLKERYGNLVANVLSVLRLWEAFGKVYSAAACDPWTDDTVEYRAERALRFLRAGEASVHEKNFSVYFAGIEFSLALNKVSNYKNPIMIYRYGNLWRLSTAAIESRGRKIKKFGRHTVNWRPLSAASVVYNYVDLQTGAPTRRTQAYNSSSMEQMMKRIVATEEASHDVYSVFARPEKIRLKLELRSYKLKCELADSLSVDEAASMVAALERARVP
eukprot:1024443-Pleurochrysis_carterae.AAC.2